MADKKDIDELSGVETTGHEWDGVKELNNPMPRWWLYTFYATVVFALLYTVAFPAWPMISKATSGVLGYSSRQELMANIAEHKAAQSVYVDRIDATDIASIEKDTQLMEFAVAGGAATFRTYCSQCHGAGAQGAKGYPNLNDDAWLWGGTIEDIYTTIAHGIRSPDDDETRFSEMPAFGRDQLLTHEQIAQVVQHVLAISGQDHDAAMDKEGAVIFADNCSSCHGEDGKGDQSLGAPNLTDAIWLYGGDRETITQTVTNSRHGVMPAWLGRLGDAQVKQVAIYVHSLGGGQ